MIIEPDFLDHWKTNLLIELLDDPCAPLYVIRLWAHCQNRKTHGFRRVNPAITKAICKAPHDAKLFEDSMLECGFIVIHDDFIYAKGWDEVNASLIASWENGKKGGRPKKKPDKNPNKTHGIPTGNPDKTDKRREEKSRVDERRTTTTSGEADASEEELPSEANQKDLFHLREQPEKLWRWFIQRNSMLNEQIFPYSVYLDIQRCFPKTPAWWCLHRILEALSGATISSPRRVPGYIRTIWGDLDKNNPDAHK